MPLTPDVYAITGVNGIGKSTLLMSISPRLKRPINFSHFKPQDFGSDSYIKYKVNNNEEKWTYLNNSWQCENDISLELRGFQEGSITKGTRFTNVSTYFNLKKLQKVNLSYLGCV